MKNEDEKFHLVILDDGGTRREFKMRRSEYSKLNFKDVEKFGLDFNVYDVENMEFSTAGEINEWIKDLTTSLSLLQS